MKRLCLLLLLGTFAQGCTTYCRILSVRVEAVEEPNARIVVEVDADLEGSKWRDHMFRFDYVVLDDERLSLLRAVRPGTPATVAEAGDALIKDDRECFSVNGWLREPEAERLDLITRNGGFGPGIKLQEGRWRYTIFIPLRMIRDTWPADPTKEGCSRPDAYELKRGCEYLVWGRVFGVKFLLEPQLTSDVCKFALRVP
jgi:hypothetical protein